MLPTGPMGDSVVSARRLRALQSLLLVMPETVSVTAVSATIGLWQRLSWASPFTHRGRASNINI